MDIEKIKNGILLHKQRSPKTFNKNINISVPMFVLYKKIFDGMTTILEDRYSLTNTELDVLSSLVIGGDDDFTLSPTELYERIIFSAGGLTKILKRLENKNYIERFEHNVDKRIRLVKLTPQGREIFDQALKDSVDYECQYFDCLDEKENEIFSKLIYKILEKND